MEINGGGDFLPQKVSSSKAVSTFPSKTMTLVSSSVIAEIAEINQRLVERKIHAYHGTNFRTCPR